MRVYELCITPVSTLNRFGFSNSNLNSIEDARLQQLGKAMGMDSAKIAALGRRDTHGGFRYPCIRVRVKGSRRVWDGAGPPT